MNNSNTWRKRRFFIGFFFLVGFLAMSAVIMLLWNWLIPTIFNLKAISYLQAMGLFLLSRMLFGGFHFRNPKGNNRPPFANPQFREKFMNMSNEERQAFKEQWKSRCDMPQKPRNEDL